MSNKECKNPLPIIHRTQVVAKSRLFQIEQLDLEFSNGEQRQYERMKGSGRGAVMMVPFQDPEHILLVREYAAGTHSYQLGFPKGLIDAGETPEQAANRELKEEIGHGARTLSPLTTLSMAPAFFNANMHILVAENLYPESLPGDEPEPLEVVVWPIANINGLLEHPDFNEARSIAALLLVERWLRSSNE